MNEYISKSNQNLVHYLSYQTYCVSFYHCIISALAKCLEALVLTMGPMASYLLKRLQSVINSAARLMFSSWRYEHITPLLCQLHWLKAAERIDYKLALLVYKYRQGVAPPYLADELCQPADTETRCRLLSASASSLIVRRTQLSTVGDRAFPVTAPCIWNSLLQHVTSAPSLAIFRSRLKTHRFRRCFL